MIADKIKQIPKRLSITSFIAQDDIKPTSLWEKEIRIALRNCKVFIPIVSRNFSKSDWTDQESGFALALRKSIIPVSVDKAPYGFIGKYQALRWDNNEAVEGVLQIAERIAEKGKLDVDSFIARFSKCSSFDDAAIVTRILVFIPRKQLNRFRMKKIVEAAIQNDQISNSWKSQPLLRKFVHYNQELLRPTSLSRFDKVFSVDSSEEENGEYL